MLDERLERVRRELDAPPWDELRESRVLGRVLEEVHPSRARRMRTAATVAGVAIAAAAAAVMLWPAPAPAPQAMASTAAAAQAAAVERSESGGSVLTLADGSRAELSPSAEVQALVQNDTEVRVRQVRGRVRYDVTRRPSRDFVVGAGDVEVRVLGTVFSIELLEGGVEVRVERGRVEVRDPERRAQLATGDSMFLAEGAAAQQALPALVDGTPEDGLGGEAVRDGKGSPPAGVASEAGPGVPDVESLLAQADRARQRGQLGQAAAALMRLVKHHRDDPQAISALFTLGRVERARGRHQASARAFERCLKRSPTGSLAEDALAGAARAWKASKRGARAEARAEQYLARYPRGPHAASMQALIAR